LEKDALQIPFFENLAPGVFKYGTVVLVEFQSDSLWYDTAYTIAAQALRSKIKTDFHVFQHPPEDVRNALVKLGLEVRKFEKQNRFRIIDSYTLQIGLGKAEVVEPYGFVSRSLKMSDWMTQMYGVLSRSQERSLIHIDENDSILLNYNTESEVLDFFRRTYTASRMKGFTFLYSVLSGVHSDSFYKQFESFADVVLDFERQEQSGSVNQLVRLRIARGSSKYYSKWRILRRLDSGEVQLTETDKDLRGAETRASTSRKLAAIVFTDIVGYSSLSQKDERLAHELLIKHRKLLRPLFSEHNGKEVKTIGDAFLIEFASALDAVNCAIEVQKALYERNLVTPPEERIVLRIGIHLGDVIHEQGDVYGDAVNIASRIEPLAEPGGISISEQVCAQVKNKIGLRVVKKGLVRLKNIHEPMTVYEPILPWAGRKEKGKKY
jgi:adenylate cyclase